MLEIDLFHCKAMGIHSDYDVYVHIYDVQFHTMFQLHENLQCRFPQYAYEGNKMNKI